MHLMSKIVKFTILERVYSNHFNLKVQYDILGEDGV